MVVCHLWMLPNASSSAQRECTQTNFRSHVILDLLLPSYLTALLASIFSFEVNCHCWSLQIWHDFGTAAAAADQRKFHVILS